MPSQDTHAQDTHARRSMYACMHTWARPPHPAPPPWTPTPNTVDVVMPLIPSLARAVTTSDSRQGRMMACG